MERTLKPVFLSSCFADTMGHPLSFRARIKREIGGDDASAGQRRPVWMAEDFPDLDPDSPWPGIEKAAFCLEGVRSAECFVAVLTERHGSPVTIDDAGTVPSSFFEAELFEAALLEKPAYIYRLAGGEFQPKLASLLTLLQPYFPNMDLRPVSEDQIVRNVTQLVRRYQRPRWLRPGARRPQIRAVVRSLLDARHRPYDVRKELPPFRFLGGLSDEALPPPDPAVVEAVLERADKEESHHVKLMLLWFAIRALMRAPYTDPAFSQLLPLWSRAFRRWTSSGAWYGIHGHLGMGCLAALGSAAAIDMKLNQDSEGWRNIPHGPLASEYYSMARLAGHSAVLLELALGHIEAAIDGGLGELSGQMAIRASIHRELGDLAAAVVDYEAVVRLREEKDGKSNGEAKSELGYALMLAGQHRRGISLMEQGLELLKEEPASGFQIRAMRKLSVGYLRQAHPLRALDLAVGAHDLAIQTGAYDQIRQLERLAKRIDRLRIWRKTRH